MWSTPFNNGNDNGDNNDLHGTQFYALQAGQYGAPLPQAQQQTGGAYTPPPTAYGPPISLFEGQFVAAMQGASVFFVYNGTRYALTQQDWSAAQATGATLATINAAVQNWPMGGTYQSYLAQKQVKPNGSIAEQLNNVPAVVAAPVIIAQPIALQSGGASPATTPVVPVGAVQPQPAPVAPQPTPQPMATQAAAPQPAPPAFSVASAPAGGAAVATQSASQYTAGLPDAAPPAQQTMPVGLAATQPATGTVMQPATGAAMQPATGAATQPATGTAMAAATVQTGATLSPMGVFIALAVLSTVLILIFTHKK